MIFLYNIGIRLYFLLAKLSALYNTKAKAWVAGQKQALPENVTESVWFHFASLGEFEQGRTLLEALRQQYADMCFVVTFFSPSGYEIRKDTPLTDYVLYLPLDTPQNVQRFLDTINPKVAFFIKYEYWFHYFAALKKRGIPLYLFSAIYRPNQVFFKWYGALHRQMLRCITHIFVQNQQSKNLLAKIGIQNVTVSGDTRFDRVIQNASAIKELPLVAEFTGDAEVLIAGSTWPKDEELLISLIKKRDADGWKFIIAPHEVDKNRVDELMNLLGDRAVRYSELLKSEKLKVESSEWGVKKSEFSNPKSEISPFPIPHSPFTILVIDNIGMLSSLYQYGKIAYIGGGFGAGIHNTLEAAAFGLPVIFGPKYDKFQEAKDLIASGAGFAINNNEGLLKAFSSLKNTERFNQASASAKNYVQNQSGATAIILQQISFNG